MQDQTHLRTLKDHKLLTNPSCRLLTADVPDRPLGSYREAPPRSAPYETNQWHLENHWIIQESLEKVIPISPSTFKMMAAGSQCPSRLATTPTQPCSRDLYRCFKRRLGCLLRRSHSKRDLVPARGRKQVAH